MTAPHPLLVEHPCLPHGAGGVDLEQSRSDASPQRRLRPAERRCLALQLVALTSLLAEFDLWPGRAALRSATRVRTRDGLLARVAAQPVSLSRVHRALGGDAEARDRIRDAALEAVCEAVGLPPGELEHDPTEPGFYLLPVLQRTLGAIDRPLDTTTARCLWAVRWSLPRLPEPGETAYWPVRVEVTARRLAAAARAVLRSRGQRAWLREIGGANEETAPLPEVGACGTLVAVGEVPPDELHAIDRWVDRTGCGAVVVGRFPRGWDPPLPPIYDPRAPGHHLAITGVPLDHARAEIARRRGWFDPLERRDARALTEHASWLFERPGELRGSGQAAGEVERLLGLNPDGLPESFLVLHTGMEPDAVRHAAAAAGAVGRDGRWRLAVPARLSADPVHAEVAALFPVDDPRRLRHQALATGDARELLQWARCRLRDLDSSSVRELLGDLEPGALGDDVHEALAESCLADLDLAGARRAVSGIEGPGRRLFETWIEVVDPPPGRRPGAADADDLGRRPRLWAELSVAVLRRTAARGGSAPVDVVANLDRCLAELDGRVRRWYEIERAFYLEPRLLRDRSWRRGVVGRDLRLRCRWMHRRALQLEKLARNSQAIRLLRGVASIESGPGRLGLVHLDLGCLYLGLGRLEDAETHNASSYRLLQAAGFRTRPALAMFNLAVGDIDRLRVERARARLTRAEDGRPDHGSLVERARLALAIGDEEEFFERVSRLPSPSSRDPRVTEGDAVVHGMAALLRRDSEGARRLFVAGGQEAEAWLALADAVDGGARPGPVDGLDAWGVGVAATWCQRLTDGSSGRFDLPGPETMTVRHALAAALVERLCGRQEWVPTSWRMAAAERLQTQGLTGWSRRLLHRGGNGQEVVQLFARLLDSGGLAGLSVPQVEQLQGCLGVRGLEVRDRPSARILWRSGAGAPGPAVARGRFEVVPLGGSPVDGAAWDLLLGLIDLAVPVSMVVDDPEAIETGFLGSSDAAVALRQELRLAAPSRLSVVIRGETGTGKDVVARALHRLSGRQGALVALNVAEVSPALIEAELFGAVPGAFTGAARSARKGLATAADAGTLFLDEIGDLDLNLQVKLLRFLESGEVRPVGSDRSHRVDARIVSATHRDLESMVTEGRFRQDLYFRLCQLTITIPPLRERRDDILELRDLFAREAVDGGARPVRWSREAEAELLGQPWPGNVRELRSAVVAATVRASGGVVTPADLGLEVRRPARTGTWDEALARCRRELIEGALERQRGNRSAAARELGISRQTLLYHMKQLGVRTP
jgi:transcriptional regulator with AAA-type ATPase domain